MSLRGKGFEIPGVRGMTSGVLVVEEGAVLEREGDGAGSRFNGRGDLLTRSGLGTVGVVLTLEQ